MASKDAHFVMRGREAVQSAGKDYRLVANFVVHGREAVRASKCEQVWQLATKHGWCSPNCSDCDASRSLNSASRRFPFYRLSYVFPTVPHASCRMMALPLFEFVLCVCESAV